MTVAVLIPLILKISIVLSVFGLGLRAAREDLIWLFRRPGLLMRSLLPMFLVMPIVATLLATLFQLRAPVAIALLALAVSPVPPLLPKRELRAVEESFYVIGLLVAAGLLAIVLAPLAVELIGRVFDKTAHLPPGTVARVVMVTVVLPLACGILVRQLAPEIAERASSPVAKVGGVLLAAGAAPILFTAWRAMVSLIGDGTLAAITAFVLAGLAAGHLLGGPGSGHRTVLAVSTACRHPAIAIAIAHSVAPGQKLVPAAVMLYLLVSFLLTVPYLTWRRRGGALSAPASAQPSPRR